MSESHRCPHQGVCSTTPAHFHAVAETSGLLALRALVINYRTVGMTALQDLSIGCDQAMALHEGLSGAGIESVVVATCNRAEIYWRARVPGDSETVQRLLAGAVGASASLMAQAAASLAGEAAARHLFRVCAGLESLVLGEAEILGQVRAALDACTGAGAFLQGVVQAALRAGRMARAETAIGVGAQSVASAAVQLLARTLSIAGARVVIVGAGDTGFKAARHLRALGVGHLVVANRTVTRAQRLAHTVSAEAIGLDGLAGELHRADAIVCAVGASQPVILADDLRRAAAARDGRALVVVDLSMPSAVEPCATPGVTCVNLSALEGQVADERSRRAGEIPSVESVVARELERLHAWARHHALRPIVSDLRRKVEAIRRAELVRAQQELPHAGAPSLDVLDRLSRRLLEQVLAIPIATLEAGDVPLDVAQAQYLRRLFVLGSGAQPWR